MLSAVLEWRLGGVMAKVLEEQVVVQPLLVHLRPVVEMTDEQFFRFCQLNRDLRIERTSEGDLLIMPPTGGRTGRRNTLLLKAFLNWEQQGGSGVAFDSSTGFALPNGAKRSPDVSWVERSRLAGLTKEEQEGFLPLCPDVVVELRSVSDPLNNLKEKMREYVENGARLGLLVDPRERKLYAYRGDGTVDVYENPESFPLDPIIPGFVLDLREIWDVEF
jgi:Uma2 family endonuclease